MSTRFVRSPQPWLGMSAAALIGFGLSSCNVLTGADDVQIAYGGAGGDGAGAAGATGGGAASAGGGQGGAANPVCAGIDCGSFGTCVDVGGDAACYCADGYHAEGLTCVENPPPGPCDEVVCGANATCDGGVCACVDGFEGDPTAGCTAIDPDEVAGRAELVDIAWAELGYCEGVDDRPYMQAQPGLWCYDFVAWVYQQSSYPLPSPNSLPRYQVGSLPAWWRPEPGDLIKFTIQHYGMVAEVSADGQVITTIEGNVSLCVRSRTTSDSSVEYYGTLDGYF